MFNEAEYLKCCCRFLGLFCCQINIIYCNCNCCLESTLLTINETSKHRIKR